MAQSQEEINQKISTKFKILELAEKETERLIKRNKRCGIEKHLHNVELTLEKLQEFKYSGQEVLLNEGGMKNLEEWLSIIDKNWRVLMMLLIG